MSEAAGDPFPYWEAQIGHPSMVAKEGGATEETASPNPTKVWLRLDGIDDEVETLADLLELADRRFSEHDMPEEEFHALLDALSRLSRIDDETRRETLASLTSYEMIDGFQYIVIAPFEEEDD